MISRKRLHFLNLVYLPGFILIIALIMGTTNNIILTSSAVVEPIIDGQISKGEWENAENYQIALNNGRNLNFSIMYTLDEVFYLAIVDQSFDGDEINMEVDKPHDYFGIEFDNNKDEAIMGTTHSPDDTILVNYMYEGAADMFMTGARRNSAVFDVDNGGIENTLGAAQEANGFIIYEIKRSLITNDIFGHDISLKHGDTYQIMLGVWDDQPPHSAAAAFNTYTDNSQFLTFTVGGNQYSPVKESLGFIVIVVGVGLSYKLFSLEFFSKNAVLEA